MDMPNARVERRLTAILAADVAGYSRLMGADEEGTLSKLKAHRLALVDPKITEHRGRIVKTTGDGCSGRDHDCAFPFQDCLRDRSQFELHL
jgi:class 3 adenylate cyclase